MKKAPEVFCGPFEERVVLLAPGHTHEGREGALLPLPPADERSEHDPWDDWRQIRMSDGYIAFARVGEFAQFTAAAGEAPE